MSGAMMAAMIVLLLGSGTDPRGGMVAAFSSSPAGRTRSIVSTSSFAENAIFNRNNNKNNNNYIHRHNNNNNNNNQSNHRNTRTRLPAATATAAASALSKNNNNNNQSNHRNTRTRLPAATATAAASALSKGPLSLSALAALTSTISGGLVSGSLHAIAGPDHLAALIPRCCGLPWHKAARVGAVWGLGHGVSATLLGVCGFLFKKGVRLTGLLGEGWSGEQFNLLHHAGSFMELAIGASLIVIGLLGIKEARDFVVPEDRTGVCDVDENANANADANAAPQSLSSAVTPPATAATARTNPAKRAVLLNGILHGFSWDGAPSLAPAVAIATWRGSLAFLLSYAVGTMAAMTVATTLIGEGTRRASFHLDRPDLPKDLSVASSFLALIVGVVWCWLALK
eukprot:CAMPEP_0171417680 /NCGR_PEP_ID=MMETSP0880-20121228/40722_1 /TAXON_ID=67004 /ORGANISM="Thalassiosira weissflogii, Strain CCMP1336" /LENGTH=397 /DNA_ID=CAMNT_0011935941 /DNA_START=225 /DNA_END=1418 /DNA_ORIENTATION=+